MDDLWINYPGLQAGVGGINPVWGFSPRLVSKLLSSHLLSYQTFQVLETWKVYINSAAISLKGLNLNNQR